MVCKVFFAKKLSEKGRKSGNKLSGMLFAAPVPCKLPPKHRKRQTFHSASEEAEKHKPFGLKTRFPGADLLPAKLLCVLHYGQKKFRIPVLCKGEQQLINGGLRLPLRALLGQRKRGRKHLQLEGADRFRCGPQAGKVVIVRVAAGHGAGGTARGNAVLFGVYGLQHPVQLFYRGIRLCGKTQTSVQHLIGVVRFGLAGGGPGKPHEGTEKGISFLLGRGDRRF